MAVVSEVHVIVNCIIDSMLVCDSAAAEEGQGGVGKPAGTGARGARQSTLETHGQA